MQTFTTSPATLFGYAMAGYDEMLDRQHKVRPHWAELMRSLQSLGAGELELRHREALKLLRENGVTYNVYGDPDGLNRPWQLDTVPLLVSGEDWLAIETGLKQRAELLNLILSDLYGRRELIRNKLLPLDLIYGHSGFLRPCDQVRLPGQRQLILYAADIARGPDNKFWVIGDRTQAPSGAGYALENRVAVSRVLPHVFRDIHPHRLLNFFQSMQAGLNDIAPSHAESPRVVVLTPGPFNETFFEHAYLASFLGYPLVQGDDLTVRDGHVWLKSLTGLQRVDVILRRMDDTFCDPLELRDDSRLGIPGLLEVARRGNVAIANPLGSGVLENPGIQPFLPGIAQALLGQPLLLPSAATWWCGQPREMDYVLANMEHLVLKPIFRQPGLPSAFGHLLSQAEKEQWRARIRARPEQFIGQEHVSFSTAPCITASGLEPRKVLLRCFGVARHSGYEIMPGALGRSAPDKGDAPISNQTGSISKDTWIIADVAQQVPENILRDHALAPRRGHNNALPSRAADNIFWVGRYAERAEASARLLRATLKKIALNPERGNPQEEACARTLLRSVTSLTGTWPGFFGEDATALLQTPEPELLSVALEQGRAGSLAHTLRALAQAGFAVRDLWSSDTWRVVEEIEAHLAHPRETADGALWLLQEHLDTLITALSAFSGLVMESMTRGNGWLFLDIGRRLERGMLLIATLRTAFSTPQEDMVENQLIEALLDASDNLICYRQHYRSHFDLPTFLELLLLDEHNPRSLAYQIARLHEHAAKLPQSASQQRLSGEERLTLEAHTLIGLARLEDWCKVSPDHIREELDQQLSRLYYLLGKLSETLTSTYFRHGNTPQTL